MTTGLAGSDGRTSGNSSRIHRVGPGGTCTVWGVPVPSAGVNGDRRRPRSVTTSTDGILAPAPRTSPSVAGGNTEPSRSTCSHGAPRTNGLLVHAVDGSPSTALHAAVAAAASLEARTPATPWYAATTCGWAKGSQSWAARACCQGSAAVMGAEYTSRTAE